MQPIGLVPWLVLAAVLAAYAPRIRTAIVGWPLVLAGIAVFAVRLHHAGPYPFSGAVDFASGAAALGAGALLVRSPWSGPRAGGTSWITRALLGAAPILLLLCILGFGHEAEEVVVLRTHALGAPIRETRLWIVDHDGSPWIVTGRGSDHDRDLVANPRVEIVRNGERRCWLAERHLDRPTLDTLLAARSEKYAAQRFAFATGIWKHFSKNDALGETAVALRFTPCR